MKNSQPRRFSRRQFLGEASCATVGTISVLSTLLNLKMANQLAAADLMPTGSGATDYKSLVCIFQAGGNDSFNMLVPRGNTEYGEYAASRSNLALPQGSLLNLNLDAAQAGSLTGLLADLVFESGDSERDGFQPGSLFHLKFAADYPVVAVGAPAPTFFPDSG